MQIEAEPAPVTVTVAPAPARADAGEHYRPPEADDAPAEPAPPDGVALAWHCRACGRVLGRVWIGRLQVFREPIAACVPLSAGRVVVTLSTHSPAPVRCLCGACRSWGHG